MNSFVTLKTEYPAVFTVNGSFTEAKRALSLRRDEVYFITVFPLEASLLPYTVKITNMRVCNNSNLAVLCQLNKNEYLLRLQPRYGYVFAPSTNKQTDDDDIAVRFFRLIKGDELATARTLLSETLSKSISDGALSDFFDGFDDIYFDGKEYFLIDTSGKSHRYSFEIKHNLIDDVSEKTL